MNVLDLFSGIGGFSLGLERAGMRTVAFCEPEPFCRAVLAKHWPSVPCYDDVRTLTASRLADDGISVDLICGGFPCQDISIAGKGAGLAGKRSGLWYEFHRLIDEIKPRYAIIENVSALRSKGLDDVLRSLTEIGYDAEWHCIPASAVGAPHRRDRIWIVAYADGGMEADGRQCAHSSGQGIVGGDIGSRSDSHAGKIAVSSAGHDSSVMADTRRKPAQISFAWRLSTISLPQRHPWWQVESGVDRVVDGLPNRLDRLKALGNAVVPQIPEIIGKAIMRQA